MSTHLTILHLLAGYPGGRATYATLDRDLSILAGCRDWRDRMRRLAVEVPDVGIFSQGFVIRDAAAWQITGAGLKFLEELSSAPPVNRPLASEIDDSRPSAEVIELETFRREVRKETTPPATAVG